MAGETWILFVPFFWKVIGMVAGYVLSIYAVLSLPGKSQRRRLLSWSYTAIFHVGVIAYLALAVKWGFVAFIALMPELAVVLLSLVGLTLATRNSGRTP